VPVPVVGHVLHGVLRHDIEHVVGRWRRESEDGCLQLGLRQVRQVVDASQEFLLALAVCVVVLLVLSELGNDVGLPLVEVGIEGRWVNVVALQPCVEDLLLLDEGLLVLLAGHGGERCDGEDDGDSGWEIFGIFFKIFLNLNFLS
jgi:hypothetical protein